MYPIADWLLFISVLVINLGSAVAAWARVRGFAWSEIASRVVLGAAVPVAIVGILNAVQGRGLGYWGIPLLFVIWAVGAYIIEVHLRIDFRESRRPLIQGPYMVLFYVSVIALWALTWPMGIWVWLLTAASYVLHISALIYAQLHEHEQE